MWDRWIRERFSTALQELKAVHDDQAALAAACVSVRARASRGGRYEQKCLDGKPRGIPLRRVKRRVKRSGPVRRPTCWSARAPSLRRPLAILAGWRCLNLPPRRPIKYSPRRMTRCCASPTSWLRATAELRQELDRRRAGLRRNLARLAARFQRRLLARLHRDWSFDLEEGLIDAARLDRVVVNPGFANA